MYLRNKIKLAEEAPHSILDAGAKLMRYHDDRG